MPLHSKADEASANDELSVNPVYVRELNIRVPECEILVASTAVRAMVRQGQFYKLATALESGGQEGSWSFARYKEWLERRSDWYIPGDAALPPQPAVEIPERAPPTRPRREPAAQPPKRAVEPAPEQEGVLVIPSDDEDLHSIVSELEKKGTKE